MIKAIDSYFVSKRGEEHYYKTALCLLAMLPVKGSLNRYKAKMAKLHPAIKKQLQATRARKAVSRLQYRGIWCGNA